jgi:hypothetical protein
MMGSSIEKSPAGGTCLRHVGTRISLCDIRFLTARLPSLTSPVRMFFREPVFAFQVLGPRGNYPKLSIRTSAHAYVAAEDLVWCGIIQPPLGEDWETGEVGAFLPEEVRLLSAVVLSERDPFMNGALGLERGYRRQVEAVALPCALDDPAFEKYARDLAEGLRQDAQRTDWHPLLRNERPRLSDAGSHEDAMEVLGAIDVDDQLLLAGLRRMLSALYLRRDDYLEEAFVMSTISLGAALEFVRLHLEDRDGGSRAYKDVYNYFRGTFPFGDPFPEFLEWMYELRVIATHPASRYGEHWAPGLMVGMVYELENWLKVIYRHLILGDVPDAEDDPLAVPT